MNKTLRQVASNPADISERNRTRSGLAKLGASTSVLLAMAIAATGAGAQTKPASGPTPLFRFTISARPTFGTDLPDDIDRDLVDEADGEVSLRLTKKLYKAVNLQLRAGATYAPNYFDEDDGRSSLYAQVGIGEVETRLTRFQSLSSNELSQFQDTVLPYLRYRYIRAYERFFDRVKANDHRVTVGLTYTDIRGIMCSDEEWRRVKEDPGIEGLCTGDKGLYWQLETNFNRLMSDDPIREKNFATVSAKAISRPLWYGIRLFGELGGEAHFFSTEKVSGGRHRKDRLARLTLGVDLTRPLSRALGIRGRSAMDASIGARWERNWSNGADKRYERGFIVPVLSFWTNF
jgi:hypothetical protein